MGKLGKMKARKNKSEEEEARSAKSGPAPINLEKRTIDLRLLKNFVSSELPPSSMLRRIILQEKDSISAMSFLEKMDIWLQLAREEKSKE